MTGNGRGATVQQRIHECLALAWGSQTGDEQQRYFAEAAGMEDANAGLACSPERHCYTSEHERKAYTGGFSDATTLLRVAKGVQP